VPSRNLNRYSSGSDPSSGFETRREKVIDILTQAYASDIISVEEYEARAAAAAAANIPRELDDIVSDLPVPNEKNERRGPESASSVRSEKTSQFPHSTYPAYRSDGRSLSVACIMGDRRMTGNWLDSNRVNAFTIMGSTRLDLRDTDLPESGPLRIEAFVVMGETIVIVPRELPVRLTTTPLMGEAIARREVNQNVRGARRWVEVSGLVVMGSVVVKAAD